MMRGLEKFNKLVEAFEKLPTVGRKSALRFAYHLVLNDTSLAMKLSHAIESAIKSIRKCERCGALSEHELCDICVDERRDHTKLCVVESAKEIFILEEHKLFDGNYFVLASLDEEILERLESRVKEGVEEVIFALTPSLSTDALILFIEDRLKTYGLHFTKIAQGVPTGVHLENVDMLSLSKALEARTKI